MTFIAGNDGDVAQKGGVYSFSVKFLNMRPELI